MANIGSGTARQIIDSDGDVVSVTNNRLDVNATVGVGSSTFTTYAQFDAATSATALSDSSNGINSIVATCKEIIIQCDFDNTGYIMVGDAQATADTEGIRLHAGDILSLPVSSTANVSIDGSASSQKVNVAIIT
jgi:hypothetical protein|tara:strand:- start:2356 stop:2757 length:402 start_codon:yes stop_codon:yes gene_type:complete